MRSGFILIAAAAFAAACGDGAASPSDAGAPPQLQIEAPPGDSIGLAPGDSITLRVRLVTAEGAPIDGAAVRWTILGGDAGTGGATLAVATTATSGGGEAEDLLTAGPARVDFQVAAEAGDAPQALFYVSVSAAGFANIHVTPGHGGARSDIGSIELRAYRGDLGCATLDPDALPASPLPPRQVAGFGDQAEWSGFAAGEAYTILGWAVHAQSGRAVGFGCAPVLASQVTPGDLAMTLALIDRPLTLGAAGVTSNLDLSPAAAIEESTGIDRPWRILACPSGAGQLALDWLIDALAADGTLDGQTANPTGAAASLEAVRGALGPDGCRAATRAGGGPSIDAALDDAIGRGPFPDAAERQALVSARLALLDSLPLVSTLAPAGPGRFEHALVSVTVGAVTIDLSASARPVIAAEAPWSYDGASAVLRLGAHSFTARLGSALGAGFAEGPLTTDGLGASSATLGSAMLASAKNGAFSGCAAIDDVVCATAGLGATCVNTACAPAAGGLDPALTAWWRALDGTGLDLTLTGTANAGDADGDLAIDDVAGGLWTASLATASAAGTIATTGTFTTSVSPPH